MRILHVVPSYLPAVRYGGPIFTVHGLCRALAARGHEVQVFTTNVDGPGIPGGRRLAFLSSFSASPSKHDGGADEVRWVFC